MDWLNVCDSELSDQVFLDMCLLADNGAHVAHAQESLTIATVRMCIASLNTAD